MAREKVTPVIYAATSKFIDPLNCGSTISCKVTRDIYGNLNGEIALTDCTRKIEWYFNNEDDAVGKIDSAIEELREFRKAFVAARKVNPAKKPGA